MEGRGFGVRKGAWTAEEDILLRKCIEKYGEQKWKQVPLRAGLNRCRKSCRLRWLNYLKPGINRGQFTADEADLILRLHKLLGNRWSLIAGRLPGRTANDVKNYWNSHLIKKVVAVDKKAKAKTDQKHAYKINIIKPKPRTFSKELSATWIQKYKTTSNSSNITPSGVEVDLRKPTKSAGDKDNQCNNNPSTSTINQQDDNENMWWQNLFADDEEEMLGDFFMEDPIAELLNDKPVSDTKVGDTSFDAYQSGSSNHEHDALLSFNVDDHLWDLLDMN